MKTPPTPPRQDRKHHRWIWISGLVGALVLVFLLAGLLGGEEVNPGEYYEVKRGDFLVTIVEGGTLEAVREVVIRNEVEGNSRIIYIVPEGTYVTNGQLLVELDSGEAEEKLNEQEINYEKAKAGYIQAEKDLEIQKSVIQSGIDAAELKMEFAGIELEKFQKGQRLQELRNAEIDITTANSRLLLAQDDLEWSRKLYEQGFETKNTVDQGENEVLNLTLQLEKAQTNLWVLTNFDHPKMLRQFESDVEEARKELGRVIAQGEGKLAQLEADLLTQSNSLALIKRKLEDDREQLEKSKLYAPQDGLVVYAISRSRFSSESLVEEGAQVRNRQELIKLPDTSQMKVEIKVHESHVSKVKPGQKAFVVLDPLPDKRFQAVVSKVALLPDAQSRWGNPNLKVYETEVLVTDPLPDVKPGVSARAEIVITNIPNTLSVPLQAVTSRQGQTVAYVQEGGEPKPVPVEVGMFNTKFIQVISGLEEGDQVLLSPPFDAEEKDLGGAIIDESEELPPEQIEPDPRPPETEPRQRQRPSGDEQTRRPGGEDGPRWPVAQAGGGPGEEASGPPAGERPPGNREEFLKRFDANGDGQIDDSEREAVRAQFRSRSGGGSGRGDGSSLPSGSR